MKGSWLYTIGLACLSVGAAETTLSCRDGSPRIDFAVTRLDQAIQAKGSTLRRVSGKAVITLTTDAKLPAEAFKIAKAGSSIRVSAGDDTGAMYGLLDLAEQVRMHGLAGVKPKAATPRFPFRAIKFNLPWMSYRKHESLQLHMKTCRDLKFWAGFLDMMAENRFNALTLWNLHPFGYMIRPKNFPEACAFDDKELADWQKFWRTLFKMAKDRGIETYMVNWNIFVSPELARASGMAPYSAEWKYFGKKSDASNIVKRYTRECVTQLIDEYPNLTGLGITLGEQMGGMTPQEREDWLVDTFGAGMKAAGRPIKFIHRAPLSANKGSGGSSSRSAAEITRDGIRRLGLKTPPWVEIKFNWSHGHSSPKLCLIHGGKASEAYWDPAPTTYKLCWTIRNEDFFILRWGEPGFIRKHIATNGQSYTGGYFVGSECYIPAKNYIDRPDLPSRCAYGYQRQWLFYQLWGRLLYDPTTPDAVFEHAFDERYGAGVGKPMLAAYTRASRMPLRLASYHKSTWDFTLYSEGFMGHPRGEQFITLDDLIKTPPLDPAYMSIRDYVSALEAKEAVDPNRITPPKLADALERDARDALKLVADLTGRAPGLDNEIVDIRAWSHLSLYFAAKIRAGVAYETFKRSKKQDAKKAAITHLESAVKHWADLVAITSAQYPEVPVIHRGKKPFSWKSFTGLVQRDLDRVRKAK